VLLWPEIAEEWIPEDAVRVRITSTGAEEREIKVSGRKNTLVT
jgi:tRNA A37 threonylcarbamoyladenosine biosynthesis protein TsaE